MTRIFLILVLFFTACSTGQEEKKSPEADESEPAKSAPSKGIIEKVADTPLVYQNARFRNVVVKKLSTNAYRITGEGQIFEASFNWVIEDGHDEISSGYSTTDAGAPAWGKFDFKVSFTKPRENSTIHLILYEASAEDGRRTHELPVLLN